MNKSDVDLPLTVKERVKWSLYTIGVSAALASALALVVYLIANGVEHGGLADYWHGFKSCFLLFGMPGVVSGILVFFPFMNEGSSFKYGYGWYYASMVLAGVLSEAEIGLSAEHAFLISGVIVGLVCAIIYIRTNK
ncbi:hypothetical protein [Evtepia sp.]|uniref:hypothetical protein n=1 Tax=Evtepia sp. TaxID=2773933 RepID=UPI00399061ED